MSPCFVLSDDTENVFFFVIYRARIFKQTVLKNIGAIARRQDESIDSNMRHKIRLNRFTDLSLEINHIDSHISFGKKLVFKLQIT